VRGVGCASLKTSAKRQTNARPDQPVSRDPLQGSAKMGGATECPMPRALIAGIIGQDGRHLGELLVAKGYEVHGMIRAQNNPRARIVQEEVPEVDLVDGDIQERSSLIAAVEHMQPDEVYNLAAMSFIPLSFRQPELSADVMGNGVLRMLEAIRIVGGTTGNPVLFYQASPSEMFGKVHEIPQDDATAFHPRSPYVIAKVFGYYMTLNYRESYGLHASNGILFNHSGPRRGLEFVERKITNAVRGSSSACRTASPPGDLSASRDWGYAGDYVEAMWRMLHDEPEDYVVASGTTHTIREVLAAAFGALGVRDWRRYVRTDPRFLRPAEVDLLVRRRFQGQGGPRRGAKDGLRQPRPDHARARRPLGAEEGRALTPTTAPAEAERPPVAGAHGRRGLQRGEPGHATPTTTGDTRQPWPVGHRGVARLTTLPHAPSRILTQVSRAVLTRSG
jgi:GDPmannose 4,6-dehydratase